MSAFPSWRPTIAVSPSLRRYDKHSRELNNQLKWRARAVTIGHCYAARQAAIDTFHRDAVRAYGTMLLFIGDAAAVGFIHHRNASARHNIIAFARQVASAPFRH